MTINQCGYGYKNLGNEKEYEAGVKELVMLQQIQKAHGEEIIALRLTHMSI
jgi:hypothetical protein